MSTSWPHAQPRLQHAATVNLTSSRLERTTFPVQTARYVRTLRP